MPPHAATDGYFPGPVVPGHVLSGYGPRTVHGVHQFHLGVDLRAPRGTPIRSATAGTVRSVWPDGQLQGYGNTVVIEHFPGEGVLYAHMQSIDPAMRAGATVTPGQQVGTVGCTDSTAAGFSCDLESHCHLEVMTPAPGEERAFSHFHGGANWYPPRVDPVPWAAAHGVRLT